MTSVDDVDLVRASELIVELPDERTETMEADDAR